MNVREAVTSFAAAGDPKKKIPQRVIHEGDLLKENDPLVKSHPHLFRAPTTQDERGNVIVEAATAAPGEKRATKKPAKKAAAGKKPAKKSAAKK